MILRHAAVGFIKELKILIINWNIEKLFYLYQLLDSLINIFSFKNDATWQLFKVDLYFIMHSHNLNPVMPPLEYSYILDLVQCPLCVLLRAYHRRFNYGEQSGLLV